MPVYLEGSVLRLPDSGLRLATCSLRRALPSAWDGGTYPCREGGERGTRR